MREKIIVLLTILSVAFVGTRGLHKIMSEDEINGLVMR
jgi:hypothetical protein